jgi:[acyl-carrier-protein] S-malonyltransferase
MGKDLAERYPAARAVFDAADEALGLGLSTLMWNGPEEELTRTHNAQPAILVHSLAVHAVVRDAVTPVAAAGHSLGEYAAYAMVGSLTLADAARLVRRRGELMLEAGERRPGTMAAVIGLEAEQVEQICHAESGDGRVVVAANLNAPGQIVISGDPEAVERAGIHLKERGARRVLPLKVSGAFHSPLMEPAEVGLRDQLDRVPFEEPAVPVIANATGEAVRESVAARRLLGAQLTSPVRWIDCMRTAAELADGATFVEAGPGNVLAGLLKRILDGAPAVSIGSADEVGRFLEEHA